MKRIFALALMVCTLAAAYAVKAYPGKITVKQPDGTELSLTKMGDEYCHYYLTEQQQVVVQKDDAFYFAEVGSNGMLAASKTLVGVNTAAQRSHGKIADNDLRNAIMKQRESSPMMQTFRSPNASTANFASGYKWDGIGKFSYNNYPTRGSVNAVIILVEYKDVKFSKSDAQIQNYFSNALNQVGFSENGGTGSAYDYFQDASSGVFNPTFDVLGPITLANKRSYYGGNDAYGNDKNPAKMVTESVKALCEQGVDFSIYDNDGDGIVDNIFVFYAGAGEADSSVSEAVWPHAWDVASATGSMYYTGNCYVNSYACSCELEGGTSLTGIGTFVHEYSHVLGLPDLYDINYSNNCRTPDWYDAMDVGNYLNNGRTPPTYSAFERNALGWLQCEVLDNFEDFSMNLPPLLDSNKAYLLPTSNRNEFFLFENRQNKGWDAYLPGHGMLVWHIDYDQNAFNNNCPNTVGSHQRVDIVEASTYNDAAYPFPGYRNVKAFGFDTNPSLQSWSGVDLGCAFSNIAETSSGYIKAQVAGAGGSGNGGAEENPEPLEPGSMFTSSSTGPELTYYVDEDTRVWVVNLEGQIFDGDLVIPATVEYEGVEYTVVYIYDETFYGSQITSVQLPGTLEGIGPRAFAFCTELTGIDIPESVETLDVGILFGCFSLESITGKFASADNRCLVYYGFLIAYAPEGGPSTYTTPADVEAIVTDAFYECYSLNNLIINEGCEDIWEDAIADCGIETLTLPSSVTSIEESAIYECWYLEAFYGKYASEDHKCLIDDKGTLIALAIGGLDTYEIPEGVMRLGAYSIFNAYDLREITLPASITAIGDAAFAYDTQIEKITVLSTEPESIKIGRNVFYQLQLDQIALYVPAGCKSEYAAVEPWCNFGTIIELSPAYFEGGLLMAPQEVRVGVPTSIPVKFEGSEPIVGFQCDIYLPEGVSFATDQYGDPLVVPGERFKNSHIIATKESDGYLRVISYSSTNEEYKEMDGTMFEFSILVGSGYEVDDTFMLELKNVRVTNTDLTEALCFDTQAIMSVAPNYTLGDVNDDGRFTVTDVSLTVAYALGDEPAGTIAAAADVNEDNNYTVTDVALVVSFVLDAAQYMPRLNAPGHTEYEECTELSATDSGAVLGFSNAHNYLGAQFEVTLPQGAALAEMTIRAHGFDIAYKQVGENTYRAVAYSLTGACMDAASQIEIRIEGVLANGTVEVGNIVLTRGEDYREVRAAGSSLDVALSALGSLNANGISVYVQNNMLVVVASAPCTLPISTITGMVTTLNIAEGRNAFRLVPGCYIANNKKIIIK